MSAIPMKVVLPRCLAAVAAIMDISTIWAAMPSFGPPRRAVAAARGTVTCIIIHLPPIATTPISLSDFRFAVSRIS